MICLFVSFLFSFNCPYGILLGNVTEKCEDRVFAGSSVTHFISELSFSIHRVVDY